ncbi:hypothetical protein CYLTODRAFT_427586 [Cylindrobasidium torrendii FP15055 ss-10]|uniref:FAD-binding domain-containing protein n=1 Tax=Cylindrobasidium torrendii FP15055 ss-10 TaxID=1314674 RepID=A0A0D7ATK7_9AGAR|nr:hypothetical protein CYLTODRAFT_427586 [Cylindrobasidium torrendii FP15055 ss-10]
MTSSTSAPPILISGAGPAGLVAAILLRQNGIPVRIIDKLHTPRVGFKGNTLQPRSIELYKIMGILPDILPMSGTNKMMKVHLPNGTDILHTLVPRREDTPDIPYNNGIVIGQDRHEALLRDILASRYGCTVEMGTELVGFDQTEAGVTVRLAVSTTDGSPAKEETFTTPYLIACDGAHSFVRKHLGLAFVDAGSLEGAMVTGDIHIKSGLDANFWHVWGDRVKKLATIRPHETNDGRWCFMLGGTELDTVNAAYSRETFIEAFGSISGQTNIEFGDLIWLTRFAPQTRMVDKFSVGRVFVAGDAAHVHSPAGGQGLNTSIQDSFNLAWKLALVLKSQASPSLLSTYSTERLPVVANMLDLSFKLTQTFGLAKSTVRPEQAGPKAQEGAAVSKEFNQLGINYRWSPILVDDFTTPSSSSTDAYGAIADGPVHAGDRAPDAPGIRIPQSEATTTLFDVLDTSRHTVLAFAESSGDDLLDIGIDEALLTVCALSTDSDTEGYAHKHYGCERGVQYVVVRPDGYIGALCKSSDSVRAYFNLLLSSPSRI